MEDPVPLLDTPKRVNLQSQANVLKTALKEFERTFAVEHNGQKPGREDIKANAEISTKYKEYNKLRDVIAGKLSLDALNVPSQQEQNTRTRHRKHHRTDSAISLTPHRSHRIETPSKGRYHPSQLDPYDAPGSASPKVLLHAVGPTPHRDGTILGIFDMLYASGGSRKSSQETPSGSKRKIDALYDDPVGTKELQRTLTQTPRQNRGSKSVGQGSHVPASTPGSGAATGGRNHSKTPVSESKRFMLQHFFTTPSAVRFATMLQDEAGTNVKSPVGHKTPLRDQVLDLSPLKDQVAAAPPDATPPYLKRSFSFKERLLSASGNVVASLSSRHMTSPASSRTLRHAKFAPKPLSQIIADRASQQKQVQNLNEDDDDDLEALREMESQEVNGLVGESQSSNTPALLGYGEEPARIWKKKGQKRTTRRAIMRPTKMKPAAAPRFVAADDEAEDHDEDDGHLVDNEVSRVEETQYMPEGTLENGLEPDGDELEYLIAEAEQAGLDEDLLLPGEDNPDDSVHGGCDDHEDNEDFFLPDPADSDIESPVKKRKKSPLTSKKSNSRSSKYLPDNNPSDLPNPKSNKSRQKTSHNVDENDDDNSNLTRKINPNAQSHMNFRSLKIRNKNSKAKGAGRGSGRFGRNRRR